MIFRHNIYNFSVEGILAQLNLSSERRFRLSMQVASVMETQVLVAAERLNSLLKEAYNRDMAIIPEYSAYPDYFYVMDIALSQERNIGVYWDERGIIQAKFVDLVGLGDLGDLQRIQKMVHPGGTLAGWIRIYESWINGTNRKYEEIIDARTSIMLGETKAPFWQLIEDGNGANAYPSNPPMRTLTTFTAMYNSEMRAAYLRTLSVVKSLATSYASSFQTMVVDFEGKKFSGEITNLPSGSNVFVISGTTTVDKMGRAAGKGFLLDSMGNVIKRWYGWLPKYS